MYKYQQITPYLTIETNIPLGRGGFGCVYNGQYNGNPVAVKELKRSLDGRSENAYFLPEVKVSEGLKNVPCENLVKIIDVIPSLSEIQSNQYQINAAYIVMELCSGDLRGFLKDQKGKIEMSQGIYIMRSIAEGVKTLHGLGITHRDIKPENVFWIKSQTNYIFKLGDFGLGKVSDTAQTQIGTISYMAPEMLNFNAQNYSSKIDIWALGVMTHEILTGVNLFPGTNPTAVRQNILKMASYLKQRNDAKNQVSMSNDTLGQSFRMISRDEVANLIDAMLQPDPTMRSDILNTCSKMEYVLLALQNPEQVQPQNQQSLDAARQGQQQQQYVAPQNKQNRVFVMQDNSQGEKEKLKAQKKQLEDELAQSQLDLKNAKYEIEELKTRVQNLEFSSQNTIKYVKQIEDEKNELVKEKQEQDKKNKEKDNNYDKLTKTTFIQQTELDKMKLRYQFSTNKLVEEKTFI